MISLLVVNTLYLFVGYVVYINADNSYFCISYNFSTYLHTFLPLYLHLRLSSWSCGRLIYIFLFLAHAPLVLRGMCVKCSQSEIKQIQRVMSHIQKNYPKEYTKILKQYQSGFWSRRSVHAQYSCSWPPSRPFLA